MINENVIKELIEKSLLRTHSKITLNGITNKNNHYVVTNCAHFAEDMRR